VIIDTEDVHSVPTGLSGQHTGAPSHEAHSGNHASLTPATGRAYQVNARIRAFGGLGATSA